MISQSYSPWAATRVGWLANFLISSGVSGLIVLGFIASSEKFAHWFILPVFLCGSLIGTDVVCWLRRGYALLDPFGLIGIVGFHVFFLAPLLHVRLDLWMPYVVPPDDWRPWLGRMALLNAAGLVAYMLGRSFVSSERVQPDASRPASRSLNRQAFFGAIAVFMVIAAGLQTFVYSLYGGISGYIQAYSSRAAGGTFEGLGWLFMVSEVFPTLLLFAFIVFARGRQPAVGWAMIAAVLLLFVLSRVVFGGLRGSRANYVWPLFWGVGLIHLWVRPISRKLIVFGLAVLVVFMYAYGIYKSYGADALRAINSEEPVSGIDRNFSTIIVGDLARSDVQAYLLYRLSDESGSDYQLSWGRTYIGSVALLVPSAIWPDRPPSKVKEGTQALYGMSTWDSTHFRSTFAYGLGGETLLNFGPYGVPVAFGLFGVAVGLVRRWCRSVSRDDPLTLMVPFVISLCLYPLVWDSDVTIYYAITGGSVPLFITWLSSRPNAASATDRPSSGSIRLDALPVGRS